MATWSPITEPQMQKLLIEQLASCTAEERAAYERVQIPLRRVSILRAGQIEQVFAVGEHDGRILIFEDVEQGFEWCETDADGVIRSYACSQDGLQARLYELLHDDST